MTMHFTKDNFETEVLQSNIPVLVDFWAPWCGPCQMMGPIIDEIATEQEGKTKIGKVNVDEQSELAQKYGIMSIPCFIVFKDGEIASQTVGGRSKEELLELVK
jgi:thioredoxin 1